MFRNASIQTKQAKLETRDGEKTLGHTYWDGGTKYSYTLIDLATGDVRSIPHVNPPQFGGPSRQTVVMQDGIALVEEYYTGHRYLTTIFIHPNNAAKLLPAPVELTDDEKTVLLFTARLKPSYAGIADYRFHNARQKTGITRERWDLAKQSCINRKLLNKAGAITTEGRNAIAGDRPSYL
jgi:hypothetical protein